MGSIAKKDKVQRAALKAWKEQGMKGTCQIVTGLGKTFIFLHALNSLPKRDGTPHYFFAEVVDRKKDLLDQIKKYNEIFEADILNDYKLGFATYQAACKWKNRDIGLAGFDEVHELLSPKRFKLVENNNFQYTIGLSATIDVDYFYPEYEITKGEMLSKIAPICYTYGLEESIKNGTSRNLKIYVISHELDKTKKVIPAGNTKRRFYQTEAKTYEFWDKVMRDAIRNEVNYDRKPNEPDYKYEKRIAREEASRQSKINIGMSRRSSILYSAPSKIPIVNTILKNVEGRTILFGNSLDTLLKITPNVISARNSDKVNNRIRDDFEKGKFDLIGSFKKLEQGANLSNLDNVIIMSYYSKSKSLIQRLGRLRDNGEIGNVFIIVTKETQEEVWFSKMFEGINNLRFITCDEIVECLD